MVQWTHPIPHFKRHLDRFSRFCTAHYCDRPTDWQTDRHTDTPRYSVCNNRPHVPHLHSSKMRPTNKLCNIAVTDGTNHTILDSMRWFSHRRRPDDRKAPEDRASEDHSRKPPSVCTAITLSPSAETQWYRLLLRASLINVDDSTVFRFLSPVTLTFDLDIRIRARFLHTAPNRQVS